jgi:Na+(H+)/acetate symporter ActP
MVIFVLFGWLIPVRNILLLHAALVPAIVIHWRFNHDRCILTNFENWLRHDDAARPRIADQDAFIGKILSRIYRRPVSFATTQIWAHALAVIPWLLGLFRLKGYL